MIAKIVSDKRLLVEVEVNKHKAYMLLDTGASVSLIDVNQKKALGFDLRARAATSLVGAGGEAMGAFHTVNLDVRLQGLPVVQFLTTNLSGIIDSIHRESGFKICGIIGLPQIKQLELKIDADNGIVTIGY